jgi:hypothetical protein
METDPVTNSSTKGGNLSETIYSFLKNLLSKEVNFIYPKESYSLFNTFLSNITKFTT